MVPRQPHGPKGDTARARSAAGDRRSWLCARRWVTIAPTNNSASRFPPSGRTDGPREAPGGAGHAAEADHVVSGRTCRSSAAPARVAMSGCKRRRCLVDREQPPVETVADDRLEVLEVDIGSDVDHRAECGRAGDSRNRRPVARRDVVVVDDHLLLADPPPLDQDTVAVDHQGLARAIGVIVVELVVGAVLVEAAIAGHHLAAAQRAPLHVAAGVVVTATCDSAVAAAKTKRMSARLGPVGDHLDGAALDVERVDGARTGMSSSPGRTSTDRHHATSLTRRWATSGVGTQTVGIGQGRHRASSWTR